MKKKTAVFSVLAILVFLVLWYRTSSSKVIGVIRGAELEQIVIGNTTYRTSAGAGFSIQDKGRFLGWVTAGDIKCRIYSVKGDSEGKYLYRLWDWEGMFYEKEESHGPQGGTP